MAGNKPGGHGGGGHGPGPGGHGSGGHGGHGPTTSKPTTPKPTTPKPTTPKPTTTKPTNTKPPVTTTTTKPPVKPSGGGSTSGNPTPAGGGTKPGDGTTPAPTKFEIKGAKGTLVVNCDKEITSKTVSTKPKIVDILPFEGTPKSFTLLGVSLGKATVIIMYADKTNDQIPVTVVDSD